MLCADLRTRQTPAPLPSGAAASSVSDEELNLDCGEVWRVLKVWPCPVRDCSVTPRLILSLQGPGGPALPEESINRLHFRASHEELVYKDPDNCACFLLLLRATLCTISVFFGLMATVCCMKSRSWTQ